MAAVMETVSGKMIDVINPKVEDIIIEDIAWHLSRLPRFCGATVPTIPYSVAQHSIQVSRELNSLFSDGAELHYFGNEILSLKSQYIAKSNQSIESIRQRMRFLGLMHDAAEAYIGDIPSPIKHIPGFKEQVEVIESALLDCIYKSLGVSPPTETEIELVHFADMVQRKVEAYNFMYSRGHDWNLPKVSLKKLQEFEPPMLGIVAYEEFMNMFKSFRSYYGN